MDSICDFKEDECLSAEKKSWKSWVVSKRTMTASVFCVIILLLPSIINVFATYNYDVDVDDLPYTNSWGAGPYDVSIRLYDVKENMTLGVTFSKSTDIPPSILLVNGENYGTIELGITVFAVHITGTTYLNFTASLMNITIQNAEDGAIIQNGYDDAWLKGKTYPEDYQRYNSTSGVDEGYRAIFKIPKANRHTLEAYPISGVDYNYMTLTDSGICNFSKKDKLIPYPEESTIPSGIMGLKISTVSSEHFIFELSYLSPEPALYQTYPDLFVSPDEISFSDDTPDQGDVIWVNATIHNIGDADAGSFDVIAYYDLVEARNQIGTPINFISLNEGDSALASFQWDTTGVYENHTVRLLIDTDDNVEESNETNHASKNIFIDDPYEVGMDNDNDDLPDYWETQYGLDPSNKTGDNGTYGDPDKDNFTNIQEYQNLTNPMISDTDSDGLLDGFNNSLIELELKNMTLKNETNPPPYEGNYYIMMNEWVIQGGDIFPYAGYRVPTNSSSYWNLSYNTTIYPNETLSVAYKVLGMPLNIYFYNSSNPISQYSISVNKTELEINKTEYIELNDTKTHLIIKATILQYNFTDPDPLCADGDWDGIDDIDEIDYLSSRVVDFRDVDTDGDGIVNYLDVDSDNDNATDGIEMEVNDDYNHVIPTCYSGFSSLPILTDPLDPDTDNDGLLDGDERFTYHSNPNSQNSDNDPMGDYYEVKTWFMYGNITMDQDFFYDNTGKSTLNVEEFVNGMYMAKIYASARIKNETSQNVSKALNITLRSSTNTTLSYEMEDSPPVVGIDVEEVLVSYKLEFEKDDDSIEIIIESNGTVFWRITDFRLTLNYTMFYKMGIAPYTDDTDGDGLLDDEEIDLVNYADSAEVPEYLAPANKDTDFDHFWDGGEIEYWEVIHKVTGFTNQAERAKNTDYDDDRVPDGDEVIFGIDPIDADPDGDSINDYEELYQYVPMWRDDLNQTVMGVCNETGSSFQYGSLTQYFEIDEKDSYMLKLVSLDTINRSLIYYNNSLLNDKDYLARVNNELLEQSSIINVSKNGTLLITEFETDSMVVNKTIYGEYINITERRYFTVTAILEPETNYSISFDINVVEINATVVVSFNQFIPARQGLHPFKVDIDGDGLADGIEAKIGSNPFRKHSDDDDIDDFDEYNGTYGYKTDPAKEDTDGDGLWDGYNKTGEGVVGELNMSTNATNVDTDGDTLWDGYNISGNIGELSIGTNPNLVDTDNDTMPDNWEYSFGGSLSPDPCVSDASSDPDNDNLKNGQEYSVDTFPRDNDTDDDGLLDGDEILGVLFRTNIVNGAINIQNYETQDGYKWIFYNGTPSTKYEYNNESVETETQVTSNTSSQINPAIHGDYIVWQDDRNASAGWDIWLFNLSSGEEFRVTNDTSNQTNPAIYGDYIVWQDDRNTSSGWDIYIYNISSGNETRISENISDEQGPAIYGDIVIWVDERNANATNGWQKEIYMFNIKNQVEMRVTDDTISDDPDALLPNQTSPWIYESTVVWLDDKYNGSNVYLHQASGGKYLTNDSYEQTRPRIFENIVVWEDHRNGNADIYMYDTNTNNLTQVTTNSSDQKNPFVYKKNILWEDYRNGNADIYLYNTTTSTMFQLTNNSENQTVPAAYSDRFVWEDDRNGNKDVYMYNLTLLLTLADNSTIYYNFDRTEIYVWKANEMYYRFNESDNTTINTSCRPLDGYRFGELYEGPSPFDPDSDADGVYDGQEPYWNIDNDTDGKINVLDTDSDGDLVPDGREVRVGYRTNADDGIYDSESWIAIDLNVSDEMFVLSGFWFNVSANDTNMASYTFVDIIGLLTPDEGNVSYNSTNGFIRIGPLPNASYFAANESVTIKVENYGQARYTARRQETTFIVDYSVDADLLPNIVDNDSDDDGILDGTEPLWYQDIDYDGFENMVDKDSDGDKILDGIEDANHDGDVDDNETSMINVDTDNDGVIDSVELNWSEDSDNDTLINAADMDSDNDGVTDGNEVRVVFRTNAMNGVYNSTIWVAVTVDEDAWDPDSYPPYGYNLTGFWYDSTVESPGGILLGYTFENDEVRYDSATEVVYVNKSKFITNSSSEIVNSTQPTLSFTKHRKESIVFYNITDGDNLYNFLDNDSDDDKLLDGLEDQDNNGVIDSDETDPYWQDTDMDGLPDGLEDSNLNGTRDIDETHPLDVDTDDDTLWDGWKDLDNDAVYDPFEYGEDTNANGTVDVGETDPLLVDSDGDTIWDNEESISGTYWWEAEDYLASGAQKLVSENASTGSEIQMDQLNEGLYQLWVMARSATGGGNYLTFGVEDSVSSTIISSTVYLLNTSLWFNTSTFEITSGDLPIKLKAPFSGANSSIYIDKILLLPLSTIWDEESSRVNDRFDSSFNQTSPAIATEEEFVYHVWTDNRSGNNDIYLNIYDIYTGAWEFKRDVKVNRESGNSNQSDPSIAVEDGNIYVAWTDDREGTRQIYFNMYNSTKNTWISEDVKVNTSTYDSTNASIAVINGNIYVVWQEITNLGLYYSGIFLSNSTNEGQTFSNGTRIDEHNIALEPKINGYHMNYGIHNNEDWIFIVWTKDDSHENSYDKDVYFNYSYDGGNQFIGSMRIDKVGSSDDFSPSIAVDSPDFIPNPSYFHYPNIHISWINQTETGINVYYSLGGYDNYYYFQNSNKKKITGNNYANIIQTSIASDINGNVHIVWDGSNDGSNFHINYSTSYMGLYPFSDEISISNTTEFSQYPVVGTAIRKGVWIKGGIFVGWQVKGNNEFDIHMIINRTKPSITSNPSDADTDDDGLTDEYEIYTVGTDPLKADSDHDGVLDGTEIGLTSPQGSYSADTFQADVHNVTTTDPLHRDSDKDGLFDGYDDLNLDRKHDTYEPGEDFNSNGNAIGENETYPTDKDTDDDGLLDGYGENWDGNSSLINPETDPLDLDSDDDGLWDGFSRIYNGTLYFGELSIKTDPNDRDTDGDCLQDGTEIGVYSSESSNDTIMNNSETQNIISPNVNGTDTSIFISDADTLNITDPLDTDTDDDGLWDGFIDTNGNGIWDSNEYGEDWNRNGKATGDGETDAAHQDTDRDGLTDGIGENWDGDGFFEPEEGETHPLDVDTDDDGLWDGYARIYEGVLYIGELSINTSALNNDTDSDGLQDGTEIGLYYNETSDSVMTNTEANALISGDVFGTNLSFYVSDDDPDTTTKPLINDTDNDGLFDGWVDSNSDGYPQPDEGEDFSCNGKVDFLNISNGGTIPETIPYRLDSDFDGLNDSREVMDNVYWFEAEDNMILGAVKVDNDQSSTGVNITIPNPSIPEGSYMFYVKANTTVAGTQMTFGAYNTPSTVICNKTVTLTEEYLWFNTTAFNIQTSDLPVYLYAPYPNANSKIYIEKVMLVMISDETDYIPIITSASSSSVEFDGSENQTVFVDIPEDMYVKSAILDLLGDMANGFYNTGGLSSARSGHTATLLNNGSVLITGGGNYLSSSEIYDPTTGTWFSTSESMETGRKWHTATLLANGTVLIAGGKGSGGYLSSSELYDPVSDTWTTVGSMGTARANHTALLLNNETVLVAGGDNSGGSLASSELYVPATDSWTSADTLNTQRSNHTATLFANGKVLVTGGVNNGVYQSSTELYEPLENKWTTVNSLNTARSSHTAVLLNNGLVLVTGGENSGVSLFSSEIYDLSEDQWTVVDPLNTARKWHSATLLENNKVLVVGGENNSVYLSSSEIYDPANDQWTAVDSLDTGRYWHTATLMNSGKVLIAGGIESGSELSSSELFNYSYCINVTLNIGNDTDFEWQHTNKFYDGSSIPDFSDEMNEYIFNHRSNFSEGVLSIPLTFYSNTTGKISLSALQIVLAPDVYYPMDNDTDDDSLLDGFEKDRYYTHSLDIDSDDDQLRDYEEIMGTDEQHRVGTHPAHHDTDNDGLWDGFEDINGNGIFDLLIELGEDVNTNYMVDYNETHPLDPDTDNDALVDGVEVVPGVIWFQAENYTTGQVIADIEASMNFTVGNSSGIELIDDDSFPAVPSGDYILYVRAKSNLTSVLDMEYFSSGLGDWQATGDPSDVNADSGFLNISSDGSKVTYANNTALSVPSSDDYKIEFDYKYPMGSNMNRFLVWAYYDTSGPDIEIWQTNDRLYANAESISFASLTNTVWHHFEIVSVYEDTFMIYLDDALVYNSSKVENGSVETYHQVGDISSTFTGNGSWDNIALVESSHINITVRTASSDEILEIVPVFEEYGWYMTSSFVIDGDGSFEVDINDSDDSKATAYVDKLMLVEVTEPSALTVTSTIDSNQTLYFSDNDTITFYIDLKVKDTVPMYVVRATMDITGEAYGGSYTTYPYLNLGGYDNISIPKANLGITDFADCNLGDLVNMTLPQWAWYFGEFRPENGTQRLLDFAGELNKYIRDRINEPGYVNESGYLRIPLQFHSDTKGKIVLSNIMILLAPHTTDGLSNDTDGDGLLDSDEGTLWTYSLKWDSDNDGLYDVIEPIKGIGTDPVDSDTENDLLMDGNSDELKVIFRAGNSSGQFNGYNESTWIAIQNLIYIPELNKTAPSAEHSASRLIAYGYDGNVSSLPNPDDTVLIVFNTTEEYRMYYDNVTGHILIEIAENDYREFNTSQSTAQYAVNLTQPQVSYALNRQEVYSNAALTADKDGDGLIDGIEPALGLSTTDADCDNDGLWDGIEYYLIGTNPLVNDTDGDFVRDGTEMGLTMENIFVVRWDLETNTLIWGTKLSEFIPDADPTTTTNPLRTDSDNDGICDGFVDTIDNDKWDISESGEDRNYNGKADGENETEPTNPDSDGDGLIDGYDENPDGDGQLESGETDPLDVDTDDDGLWDGYTVMLNSTSYIGELSIGCEPRSNDTDGDKIQDGTEIGLYYNSSNPSMDNILDNSEAAMIWTNMTGTNISRFVSDQDTVNTTIPTNVDTDEDGLDDGEEDENYNGWFENDYNETDPLNKDTDFDGIWDGTEDKNQDGDFDPDGLDGTPGTIDDELDPNDCDTDDDGIADGDEKNWDQDESSDADNIINARDPDSDGDGIDDGVESGITDENKTVGGYGYTGTDGSFTGDMDSENTTDPLNPDTDGDGIKDGVEDVNGDGWFEDDKDETDPLNKDTDFDRIPDGMEDTDYDGVVDEGELDPNDCDTDDDGIMDGYEKFWDEDTDEDGTINALDTDSDNDDIIDGIEAGVTSENKPQGGYGFNGTNESYVGDADPEDVTDPLDDDTDDDGIPDGLEDENHNGYFEDNKTETDPNNKDTDNDRVLDGEEDYNKDGLYDSDGADNTFGTADDELNPNDCDTDDDGIKDGWEIDWNKDTDGDGLINALDADSDGDNITDGVESGVATGDAPGEGHGYNGTSDSYWGDNDTLTTTDPVDFDTDGDGIPDGWIDGWTFTCADGWHLNTSMANYNGIKEVWEGEDLDLDGVYDPDIDSKTETDPISKDSDSDGIPDGFEFALSAKYLNESFGLNPLNASDVKGDLDDDTLTNLEEYKKGIENNDPDIDFDDDGNINFYDTNDDADPWQTIDELYWGLDPYLNDYTDNYDLDNDGLGNKFEWDNQSFVNLTADDSDGDDLKDGWEYNYWDVTRDQTSENALLNCSVYDSDGDNIGDGQELEGYEVTVSWYEGEDLKSKDIKVYGDPMYAYKDPQGNFLDVDEDGIYDIDEIDPVNSTRLTWYFDVLKHDPRNETAKNEQVQNQFNPYIRENIPPKIENLAVKTSAKYHTIEICFVKVKIIDHCYARITVEISDVSDFTAIVLVLDNGKYVSFTGKGNEVFEASLDIDFWTDYLLDYKVKVIAADVAGNQISMEKKINGVFGGLLDALTAIWDAIVGAFTAAFELMMAALSFLIDLILDGIRAIIDAVIVPIITGMKEYAKGIGRVLEDIMYQYEENGKFNMNDFYSALFGGSVFTGIIALISAITVVMTIVNVFTGVISGIMGIVSNLLIPLIITTIANSIPAGGYESLIASILSGDATQFIGMIPSLFSEFNDINTNCWAGVFITGISILCSIAGGFFSVKGIAIAAGHWKIGKPLPSGIGGLIGDIIGLALSVAGLILSIFFTDIWAGILGEIIAGIGLILCVNSDSSFIAGNLYNNIADGIAVGGFFISIAAALYAIYAEAYQCE